MTRLSTKRAGCVAIAIAAFLAVSAHAQQAPPTDAQRAVGKVNSKDGTPIAYERVGEGPTLILVAGALSDRNGAARLASLLAPQFTVISYDRRGRGDSGDTQPYSVQREVEDIEALIDECGDTAYVFGASSGAVLALESAARLGPKVKKAALFEPPFIVDDSRKPIPADWTAHTAKLLADGNGGGAVEYFMTVAVGVPAEHIAPMKQSPMWSQLEKLAHTLPYDAAILGDTVSGRPLPVDRWENATMPVLVMVGGNSDPWLKNGSDAIADLLPDARHQVLPGLDHSGTFMAPQAFVPVLSEFFLEEN